MYGDTAAIQVSPDTPILQAMRAMEAHPKDGRPAGIVVVTEKSGRLAGVVTDGDVRRAILKGIPLDVPVSKIMTADPITIGQDQVEEASYADVMHQIHRCRRMQDPGVGKVVVVDSERRPVGMISLLDLLRRQDVRSQVVCVVGMGYVGLTLSVALADAGLHVFGVEADSAVRTSLQEGSLHFHEVGLDRAFRAHLGERLTVGSSLSEAAAGVYLICVGTPLDVANRPCLRDVEGAAVAVGSVLQRGDLVGLRSTVPIGTSRQVVLPILEEASGLKGGRDFDLVYAPERTVAGKALSELRSLPQVIGGLSKSGVERGSAVFRELTPSIVTVGSLEEAEAVKLCNNSFRDHIFAFSNEVALICDAWRLDPARVIGAANKGYPRDPIPAPSPSVGGTCLRKDPFILMHSAREVGLTPVIVGQSREVNEQMPHYVAGKVLRFVREAGRCPEDAKIFIVGFAFKGEPETSDIRESGAVVLVNHLLPDVKELYGYDPVISPAELRRIEGVRHCQPPEGFAHADCVVIMNNHRSYLDWDIHPLLRSMNRPAFFFDGWRLFEPSDVYGVAGVKYSSVGVEYSGDSKSHRGQAVFEPEVADSVSRI